MNARHDHSDCPAKHATRLATLEVVCQSPILIHRNGYLNYDWAELTGLHDQTLTMLRDGKYLRPWGGGKYIGINGPDPSTEAKGSRTLKAQAAQDLLASNEAEFGTEDCSWIFGNIQDLIREQPDLFDNTGVLVYDSFDGIGRHSGIKGAPGHLAGKVPLNLSPLITLFLQQALKLGHAVLAINLAKNISCPQALQEYQQFLQDSLHMNGHVLDFEDYRSKGAIIPMRYVRFTADASAAARLLA